MFANDPCRSIGREKGKERKREAEREQLRISLFDGRLENEAVKVSEKNSANVAAEI